MYSRRLVIGRWRQVRSAPKHEARRMWAPAVSVRGQPAEQGRRDESRRGKPGACATRECWPGPGAASRERTASIRIYLALTREVWRTTGEPPASGAETQSNFGHPEGLHGHRSSASHHGLRTPESNRFQVIQSARVAQKQDREGPQSPASEIENEAEANHKQQYDPADYADGAVIPSLWIIAPWSNACLDQPHQRGYDRSDLKVTPHTQVTGPNERRSLDEPRRAPQLEPAF